VKVLQGDAVLGGGIAAVGAEEGIKGFVPGHVVLLCGS
jgi:hypothetical protein